ncbi:glycoside hydrolase family 76 protein [Sphingobacterium sp. BIGb0165]|uniref:glycoside hydrolase family 76 protein n=1 Tax=Sphingobacterium sp. BIGb0165 TaxID=2940615 RepID=UPI002169EF9A|nr:glycoside hydrolase family 76 protein [Sphingobacterium sp. BIGb0165]MCS4228850.1 putative alpha-1,6-mannanase (GH76 family) [Sphingobacterium sp. BIGb0165]
MKQINRITTTLLLTGLCYLTAQAQIKKGQFSGRAQKTLDVVYDKYGGAENKLLIEKYPFDENFKADYLNNNEQAGQQKKYAYLWPFSGSFSAVNALMELSKDKADHQKVLDQKVLVGLREYRDEQRTPVGYASYINSAPASDRFYDDNIWLGIDFTDSYIQTKKADYLKNAKEIWAFVKSGEDNKLGGGIYWCEQKKESKNACSNAPAAVFALKLFEATKEKNYLNEGRRLYEWTKTGLQDPDDKLYWDNIHLNGKVDKAKYSYNSGQMLQAAALLYKLTKEKEYLMDAQQLAEACLSYFFQTRDGIDFPILKNSNVWFHAVMMRGYISLFEQDGNRKYMDIFAKNLDLAWHKMRDQDGLFDADWTLEKPKKSKWLLDQCAFVEMYGRLAKFGY